SPTGWRIAGGRSRRTGNSTRSRIERGAVTKRVSTKNRRKTQMTIKSLLSTASLALLIGGVSATAQAQIAVGQLADYSGPTSDVGTPYGQAVADTFAWINKNGGVGGKQVALDTNDYGYQVPRAVALYKQWSAPDSKVAAIM